MFTCRPTNAKEEETCAYDIVKNLTGRAYRLFDYVGAPDAERVVVLMGSGCETAHETVESLQSRGEKVGVLKVRLYRPFSVQHFVQALPATTRVIAALDRTKEPGALGEPMYQDVVTAISEGWKGQPVRIIGGRFGLDHDVCNTRKFDGPDSAYKEYAAHLVRYRRSWTVAVSVER